MQSFKDLKVNIKRSPFSKEEERQHRKDKLFEETVAEKNLNLMKHINIQT